MSSNVDLMDVLNQIIAQETSEEMYKLRQLILLRMALESDIKDSRIPAPMNITEVGGYYNLLAKQKEKAMQRQLVASALGLPANYSPDMIEDAIRKFLAENL